MRRLTFELVHAVIPVADHMVVVKTTADAAQIVGSAIDALSLTDVIGTVAGDNTIFVATAGRYAHRTLAQVLGKR